MVSLFLFNNTMKSNKHKKHMMFNDTIMWFGIHKGKRLKDIPDSYFQYLLDNNISFRGIKNYSKRRLKL
jgi:hypothetical protein